jgi:hypothetical protein
MTALIAEVQAAPVAPDHQQPDKKGPADELGIADGPRFFGPL